MVQGLRQSILVVAASSLLACGGGGGGMPTAPSPAPTASGGPFDLLFTGNAVPHVGQQFYVKVFKDGDDSAVESGSLTLPADGSFSFSWSGILEANESYHLDFYADHNSSGTCDPPPDDHSWRESLGTVTGAVTHHFEHNGSFVDVCASWS